MIAPVGHSRKGLWISLYHVVGVSIFLCLQGCGGGEHSEYVEPPDADAQLVVHPGGDNTYDVFLDGSRLGRISWEQAYWVRAGQHVFGVSLAEGFKVLDRTVDYVFSIGLAETLHLAVSVWGEYGPGTISGTEVLKDSGIRISETHP